MPRNSAGVYSLPASNPVVPFTTIATSWANPTMSDIAAELTNSLDRTGRGGMLAPFRIFDGTVVQPGLAFANEAGLGLWRSAAGTMHMASLGANVFTFEPGQSTSPVKLVMMGQTQYRTTGQKWWQSKVDVDDALTFSPSTLINGEIFDATRALKFGATGSLGVPTNIVVTNGGISIGALTPVAGEIRANALVTPASGYIGINLDFAGGWVFQSATGLGYLQSMAANGVLHYLTSAASGGVGSAATLVNTALLTSKGYAFSPGIAVGAATPTIPRPLNGVSGAPLTLDMNGTGIQVALMGTSNYGIRWGFGFDPNIYVDIGPLDAAGLIAQTAYTGSMLFRFTRSNGQQDIALQLQPTGLVQIGANSNSFPGAIASTQSDRGLVNGVLDFRQYQTALVNPGSNITGWNTVNGQLFRIFVNGAGAVTLPAAGTSFRYAIGSPGNFGTVGTVISVLVLNGVNYLSFTPF
jgi:hypothetical protein